MFGGVAIAAPLAAGAQQPGNTPKKFRAASCYHWDGTRWIASTNI